MHIHRTRAISLISCAFVCMVMLFLVHIVLRAKLYAYINNNDIQGLNWALSVDPLLSHACDETGWSPIHYAIQRGNRHEIIEALLKAGADPNADAPTVGTCIMATDYFGRRSEVFLLVRHGGDVNRRSRRLNNNGQTALHMSVQRGNVEMVRAILDVGANANARDHDGNTALHFVAVAPNVNVEVRRDIVRLLLAHGADPTIEDTNGRRPEYWLREMSTENSILYDALSIPDPPKWSFRVQE